MATEYKAKLSYLRMAPRKVRSVGDLIKGLPVNEAEAQLLVQSRRPAKPLLKLLRSAMANAKNNGLSNADHLFVSTVRVDGGPMLKRILPRARGSASPIEKKMSHVTIVLGVNEELKPRFTIVTQKKKKTGPSDDSSKKRTAKRPDTPPKPQKMDDERSEAKKKEKKQSSNFWKRTFNRKAMGGE
jgi:large subunit ribosomal protein L22